MGSLKTVLKGKIEWFKQLTVSEKVQLAFAVLFSLCVALTPPTFAWFAYQNKIEAMSRVNEPPALYLAAGHNDPVQYFTLDNIDVKRENDGSYHQDFVFSVVTGKVSRYDLQVAHTTNIPFTYQLYRAKQTDETEGDIVIYESSAGDKIKYKILSGNGQEITLTNLNPKDESGRLGSENVLSESFNRRNYALGTDHVNIYAEPLYSVVRDIGRNEQETDDSEERDYFILRVTWNVLQSASGDDLWNYAFNNKETDIVYVTVKQSGTQ